LKRKTILGTLLLSLLTSNSGFGQQPARKSDSSKFRVIFTIGGGGGGFALGLAGGLAAFDDAINSNRKVWTTAILAGVAGGIGGYFLGRALDKRSASTAWRYVPDPLDRNLMDIRQAGQAAGPFPQTHLDLIGQRILIPSNKDRGTLAEDYRRLPDRDSKFPGLRQDRLSSKAAQSDTGLAIATENELFVCCFR
jgi:hypothetical protein